MVVFVPLQTNNAMALIKSSCHKDITCMSVKKVGCYSSSSCSIVCLVQVVSDCVSLMMIIFCYPMERIAHCCRTLLAFKKALKTHIFKAYYCWHLKYSMKFLKISFKYFILSYFLHICIDIYICHRLECVFACK